MRKIILVICLVYGATGLKGQQYPETQLYAANPYLINPGFTGYLTDISVYFNAMSPLSLEQNVIRNYRAGFNKSIEKSYLGIGGKLTYDQRDFFESFYLDASLSYRIVLDRKQVISFGADIGLVNRTYSLDNLSQYVDLSDQTLSSDYYFGTSMKLGLGIAYYSSIMEAGLAMPNLIEGSEKFNGHFNAYVAYKHYLVNDHWVLKPNLYFVNYPDGTQLISGSVMIISQNKFWGQLGGTNVKDLILAMGVAIGNYQLSYSYLHHLGDELPYNGLGEVSLLIHFGKSNRVLSHISTIRNRKN